MLYKAFSTFGKRSCDSSNGALRGCQALATLLRRPRKPALTRYRVRYGYRRSLSHFHDVLSINVLDHFSRLSPGHRAKIRSYTKIGTSHASIADEENTCMYTSGDGYGQLKTVGLLHELNRARQLVAQHVHQ